MLEKMHLKINTLRQELCPAAAGRQRLELPEDQKSIQRGAGVFASCFLCFFSQANGSAIPGGCGQSCTPWVLCVLLGHVGQIRLPHGICSARLMGAVGRVPVLRPREKPAK